MLIRIFGSSSLSCVDLHLLISSNKTLIGIGYSKKEISWCLFLKNLTTPSRVQTIVIFLKIGVQLPPVAKTANIWQCQTKKYNGGTWKKKVEVCASVSNQALVLRCSASHSFEHVQHIHLHIPMLCQPNVENNKIAQQFFFIHHGVRKTI